MTIGTWTPIIRIPNDCLEAIGDAPCILRFYRDYPMLCEMAARIYHSVLGEGIDHLEPVNSDDLAEMIYEYWDKVTAIKMILIQQYLSGRTRPVPLEIALRALAYVVVNNMHSVLGDGTQGTVHEWLKLHHKEVDKIKDLLQKRGG